MTRFFNENLSTHINLKMRPQKVFSILFSIFLSITSIVAQTYYFTSPEGYGAGTTGGGTPNASNTVTVTTRSALASALTGSKSVIIVSGTIDCNGSMIKAKVQNKTILGLPGARLVNNNQTKTGSGILYLQDGSTNVIIRNLIFEGPGAYDIDGNDNLCADGCTKLWVDHCTFQDGMDGNFDNKGNTDNVTISWCKFEYLKPAKSGGSGGTNDHRFSNLVGSSASDAPADGHYSITWLNCYWAEGCKERMPRARNAQLHIVNCYYKTTVSSSLANGLGGGDNNTTCYVENTHFKTISTIFRSYDSSDGGTSSVNYVGCMKGTATTGLPVNIGTVTKPSYTITIMPVANVEAAVTSATCGAGATLTVAADGTITTPCSTTEPTLALTSGSNTQNVFQNSAITNIVYTYGGTATGATVSGLPTNVTATVNTTAKTVTISGIPTVTGGFSYVVTTTQSSGTAASLSGTITVSTSSPATLSLTSGTTSQTAYVGNAISPIVYTYGGGATGVTVIGLPAGINATTNTTAKTVTISGIPTATNTGSYSVVTVGGSSSAITLTGTITVNNPTTLAIPSGFTTANTGTTLTINWGNVANASNYTINLCSPATGTTDVPMYFSTSGSGTLNTGDTHTTSASISSSINCTAVGVSSSGYRTGSANDHKLTLVNTTNVSQLKIGAKSSASTARTLDKYTINGNDYTTGITNSGVATCGEYIITDIFLKKADVITFTFSGNVQINYYIATVGTNTSTCTETTVTTNSFTATDLTTGTTYNYQVKANSGNPAYVSSVYSTEASVTTSATTSAVNAVINLTSTNGSNNQTIPINTTITDITYSYVGSSCNIVWAGTSSASTPPQGIAVNTTNNSINITGTPNIIGNYGYTINALGIAGGNNTNVSGTIHAIAPTILSTPNPSAINTSTTATLNWAAIPNATGYTVNWCTPAGVTIISKVWDFTGIWTINASSADANLVADVTAGRFNYVPATIDAPLVTAGGSAIPDVAGLLFTQTGTSKLRLGYGTGLVYLNGTGISITIPCNVGQTITIIGPAGNSNAIDRGYSVTGGTLNTTLSKNVSTTGIMNVAGADGTWVYTATSSAVKITTVVGGMNIRKITVGSVSAVETCTEIPIIETSYTATNLVDGVTYSYQVNATSTNNAYAESNYSDIQTVTTSVANKVTLVQENSTILQLNDVIIANDNVSEMSIYTLAGSKIISAKNNTISINTLKKGFYIIIAKTTDENFISKKFIKR